MDIKKLFNQTKYSLSAFVLLAMPSLIFDGFKSASTLACRLLLCAGAALFLSLYINREPSVKAAVLPTFLILSLISCNVIFLTDDVHILLSLSSFFIALFFSEKFVWLTTVFAALCVMGQPLTILILVPSIVVVQLVKKQTTPAAVSVAVSIAAFILTRLLTTNTGFYAQQSGAYYLWLHPVFFSNTHVEYLLKYLLFGFPLVAIVLFYIVKIITEGKKSTGALIILTIVLAVYGFSLSKNIHTVFMLLVTAFAILISISDYDTYKKINDKFSDFFANNLICFLLIVALIATLPLIFSSLPYDSEFFDKSTFIIFREE